MVGKGLGLLYPFDRFIVPILWKPREEVVCLRLGG